MPAVDPQDILEQYRMARGVIWRYQLDKVETQALKKALGTIETAIPDVLARMERTKGAFTLARLKQVEQELKELRTGINAVISDNISTIAGQAGAESVAWHSTTLGVQGLVPVNMIAVSPSQFKTFFQDTKLGGDNLTGWLNKSFNKTVLGAIENDLNSGLLQGKSYPELIKSITGHMENYTRKSVIDVARTYTQSANVAAQQAVMQANEDMITSWEWNAVLETSFMDSGNGTCIECAVLDGNTYPIGEGPPCPLHIRCRCFPLPVTKTWRELGIDADELKEVSRSWAYYDDIPIDEGRSNFEDWGFHKGNYATWFEQRGETFQRNALGPKRYDLFKAGDISFKDLVDPKTGRLLLLNEL